MTVTDAGSGLMLKLAVAARPVPTRMMSWELPETPPVLSVTVRNALRCPVAEGVNVMSIEQFDAAARLVPQVVLDSTLKSAALVPVGVMPEILRVALPMLLSKTDRGGLVVDPTLVDPKEK